MVHGTNSINTASSIRGTDADIEVSNGLNYDLRNISVKVQIT